MAAWTVAAIATTIFMSLYDSKDFRERLNMKISPSMAYRGILVGIMFANFIFCYVWEVIKYLKEMMPNAKMTISEKVFFLDGLLFGRLLPIYKERIRGPHLPFEHLEEELKRKPGWPPVGHCKNNDSKIGE